MTNNIAKIHKANLCYVFLKQQSDEYLDENEISKCEECKGIGLDQIHLSDDGSSYSWDGTSYCEKCNGVGYKGVKEGMQIDFLHYMCRKCGGLGCKLCEKGVVDWIAHSMGR